ncbi:MarR family winged helix-turn-helix transcriptional regulator [Streptomyces sp. NPDC058000]|uniref:MarR family winged helix-turn-helix transcriptional regulator n=1 Tax=Streptomyces sp. NPDC058000 TaxID=3346299 RepID=UPI0036EDB134
MSTERRAQGQAAAEGPGPDVDAAVRALLLLMPRMVGRVKRLTVPEELQSLALAPRHLSLLSYLLFDGPMTVNDLAARLEVAPTTVSLMIGELSRKGILERREDPSDRRRRIVSISDAKRPAIDSWLAGGATAWRRALAPLTPDQRQLFIDTLRAYEEAASPGLEGQGPPDHDPPDRP